MARVRAAAPPPLPGCAGCTGPGPPHGPAPPNSATDAITGCPASARLRPRPDSGRRAGAQLLPALAGAALSMRGEDKAGRARAGLGLSMRSARPPALLLARSVRRGRSEAAGREHAYKPW